MAQHASAIILAACVISLLGYPIAHPNISYTDWHGPFSQGWMRIFSLLILITLNVHAQVSMWTISTDYLTSMALGRAAAVMRFLFQAVCSMAVSAFFVWSVQILWGV